MTVGGGTIGGGIIMRRIAVLTSGGDAPGMNPCIRAVVRKSLYHGLEVVGVRRGFHGLVTGDFMEMKSRMVGGYTATRWDYSEISSFGRIQD